MELKKAIGIVLSTLDKDGKSLSATGRADYTNAIARLQEEIEPRGPLAPPRKLALIMLDDAGSVHHVLVHDTLSYGAGYSELFNEFSRVTPTSGLPRYAVNNLFADWLKTKGFELATFTHDPRQFR